MYSRSLLEYDVQVAGSVGAGFRFYSGQRVGAKWFLGYLAAVDAASRTRNCRFYKGKQLGSEEKESAA